MVDDLKRRMRAGEDFTLIDVRKPEVWAESNADIGSDPQARSSLQQDLDVSITFDKFSGSGRVSLPFPSAVDWLPAVRCQGLATVARGQVNGL